MKKSAGILLYRGSNKNPEFFLVHPGGPYWKNKDLGAWSIPKGEIEENENMQVAAVREFREETGFDCSGDFLELDPIKLRSGKIIYAWALHMDVDPVGIASNRFSMEWPPRSGKYIEVPEVDKGGWFPREDAILKLNPGQVPLIEQTVAIINKR